MKTVYGFTLTKDKDECFHMGETITRIGIEQSTPGRFLVDIFPIIQCLPSWFPGTGFKVKAAAWREQTASYRDKLFELGISALVGDSLFAPHTY